MKAFHESFATVFLKQSFYAFFHTCFGLIFCGLYFAAPKLFEYACKWSSVVIRYDDESLFHVHESFIFVHHLGSPLGLTEMETHKVATLSLLCL